MWPVLLDMTKEESMQSLRNLELEAYAHLVSALRAQGPLSSDKRKLLKDTGLALNIPQDRHKAEVRRAINDEKLNTIAYHVTGLTETLEDWAQEGRRSVPLIPRMAPQTAYSAIADEAAEAAHQNNRQMPHPASTERKRPLAQPIPQTLPECSKGVPFRIPETPKTEESKKRKLPICTESSSLAQHLLGHPKVSRAQPLYRQRPKGGMLKEQLKTKPSFSKAPFVPLPLTSNGPTPISPSQNEETIEQIQNEINSYSSQKEPSITNESQANRPKLLTPPKPSTNFAFKQITTSSSGPSSNEAHKTFKMSTKKTITKGGIPIGQKLIVVSNAQTIQNSSILQKTLSIPLMKNLSVKNFEKFKIVSTTAPQVTACNNLTTLKHKVVTVKANAGTRKVIPLSLINSKGGIKVLPVGGKIVGKTTTSQPVYIVNTLAPKTVNHSITSEAPASPDKENGKSSVLGDILKTAGVTTDDFETPLEGFAIRTNHAVETESETNDAEESTSEKDFVLINEGGEVEEETEVQDDNCEQLSAIEDKVLMQVQSSEASVTDVSN